MTLAFLCGLEWALYLPPPRLAHQLKKKMSWGEPLMFYPSTLGVESLFHLARMEVCDVLPVSLQTVLLERRRMGLLVKSLLKALQFPGL